MFNSKRTIKRSSIFVITLGLFGPTFGHAYTFPEQQAILESYTAEAQKNIPKSIDFLSKLLIQYPKDYFINMRLGWLFYLSKRYSNAVFHYEAAFKAIPTSAEPLLGLTLTYLVTEDYSKLIGSSERLLKLDPRNLLGWQRLLTGYIKMKQYDNVVTKASEALLQYPTDTIILEQKGFAEIQLGRSGDGHATLGYLFVLSPYNEYAKSILGPLQ